MENQFLNRLLSKRLPLVAYLSFIFFLSAQQNIGPQIDIPQVDKAIHILIYFPVAILFFRAFRDSDPQFLKKNFMWMGIIAAMLFAISDECHQAFVPSRHSDVFDVLADTAGIFLAAWIYWKYLKKKNISVS